MRAEFIRVFRCFGFMVIVYTLLCSSVMGGEPENVITYIGDGLTKTDEMKSVVATADAFLSEMSSKIFRWKELQKQRTPGAKPDKVSAEVREMYETIFNSDRLKKAGVRSVNFNQKLTAAEFEAAELKTESGSVLFIEVAHFEDQPHFVFKSLERGKVQIKTLMIPAEFMASRQARILTFTTEVSYIYGGTRGYSVDNILTSGEWRGMDGYTHLSIVDFAERYCIVPDEELLPIAKKFAMLPSKISGYTQEPSDPDLIDIDVPAPK